MGFIRTLKQKVDDVCINASIKAKALKANTRGAISVQVIGGVVIGVVVVVVIVNFLVGDGGISKLLDGIFQTGNDKLKEAMGKS